MDLQLVKVGNERSRTVDNTLENDKAKIKNAYSPAKGQVSGSPAA